MKKGEKIKLKKERTNNIQSAKWFPQTGKENTRRCTKWDKDKKDTPNQNKGQNVYLVRQSAAKLPISFTMIEEDRPPYLCFCSTPPTPCIDIFWQLYSIFWKDKVKDRITLWKLLCTCHVLFWFFTFSVARIWKSTTLRDSQIVYQCSFVVRWRTARVFISSTFRDMHGERDLLTRFVFPELRALGRQHFINVFEVDLRWGVTEEASSTNK